MESAPLLDASAWLTICAVLGLLCMSAFFSGSETALTAASRGRLHALADKGSYGARLALRLTDNSERLIGAVLLGNNLVNILAAALATSLFLQLFGEAGVPVATLVMTLLVLVFAEVLPKTYAILRSEQAATLVSRPISVVVTVFAPLVAAVQVVVRGILYFAGLRDADDAQSAARAQAEIAGIVALGHSEGNVDRDDRDRLLGALELKELEVEEIMLHRSDMEMLDLALPPDKIINQCLNSPYTRLPVYRDDPENIIGVIHAKDLLRAVNRLMRSADGVAKIAEFDVMSIAMKPYFVPEKTTLNHQLREFLRRKTHFALVIDEYGALQGLVTLEDIIEEVIGEIADEHDVDDQPMPEMDETGSYVIDGAITIRNLNRTMDWSLPDEEANTIAGLVIHEAQMIPDIGQVFIFHNHRFEISGRAGNKVTQLKIRQL
ncbi:MAG: HlyC/CorC family transporter [Rhodobacteraceae bacterium]|nr:HlyC/CorC family transporter [Paracoccaceae bacterium]